MIPLSIGKVVLSVRTIVRLSICVPYCPKRRIPICRCDAPALGKEVTEPGSGTDKQYVPATSSEVILEECFPDRFDEQICGDREEDTNHLKPETMEG